MNTRPLQLSRLRQIGWNFWDPIGIRGFGNAWQAGAADEYDRYLLVAANMLVCGSTDEEATAYLKITASDHMGLGHIPTNDEAAARTVQAIMAYLDEAT